MMLKLLLFAYIACTNYVNAEEKCTGKDCMVIKQRIELKDKKREIPRCEGENCMVIGEMKKVRRSKKVTNYYITPIPKELESDSVYLSEMKNTKMIDKDDYDKHKYLQDNDRLNTNLVFGIKKDQPKKPVSEMDLERPKIVGENITTMDPRKRHYYYYSDLSFLYVSSASARHKSSYAYNGTDYTTLNVDTRYGNNFGASIKTGIGLPDEIIKGDIFGLRFDIEMLWLNLNESNNKYYNSSMQQVYPSHAYSRYGRLDIINLSANAYVDFLISKTFVPYIGVGLGSAIPVSWLSKNTMTFQNFVINAGVSFGREGKFFVGYKGIIGLNASKGNYHGYDTGLGSAYALGAGGNYQTSLVADRNYGIRHIRIHMIEFGIRF